MNKNDLKIELRCASYGDLYDSRVLEYRISPEQELTYYEKVKVFGLTLFKLRHKYSCEWIRPHTYWTSSYTAKTQSNPDIHPIWLNSRHDFEYLKQTIHTYGDMMVLIDKMDNEAIEKHKEMREEFLNINPKYIY